MRKILDINDFQIVWMRRHRQKNLRLNVKFNGEIVVTSCRSLPESGVRRFVLQNESWLREALDKFKQERARFPPKRYEPGEEFLFLGRPRRLTQVDFAIADYGVQVRGDQLQINGPSEDLADRIGAYYYARASEFIPSRVLIFSKRTGLTPARVTLRGQRTRWGSCSHKGWINLNYKLMAAPLFVIDYVVIHELCHLAHPNHSRRFWQLVELHCPEFKKAKDWLRAHQMTLSFLK